MKTLEDLPPLLYYYHGEKDRFLADAIMHGFQIQNWRPVGDAKCYPGDWIHVTNSLQHGSFQILKQCIDERKPYIFIDNGYVFNHLSSQWMRRPYRVVPNAFQHYWIPEIYDDERSNKLWDVPAESLLNKWKQGYGDHILLIPQSSWESNKLFNLDRWVHKMYQNINVLKYSGEIRVRQKGHYQRPLEMDLLGASACFAYTSNVAVDALRAGVPTFCFPLSAAYPSAKLILHGLCMLNEPKIHFSEHAKEPSDRLTWIKGLVCGQFTHTEISNGFAKEKVMEEMLRRLNQDATIPKS